MNLMVFLLQRPYLRIKTKAQPIMVHLKNKIKPNENGPNILPIAPNKIKSPPPIPSLLYIALKTKFTNQSEEYPIKKPKEENWIGFKLNK